MKFPPVVCAALVLCSCGPVVDSVVITGDGFASGDLAGFYAAERAFVESFFAGTEDEGPALRLVSRDGARGPFIVMELVSSWIEGGEKALGAFDAPDTFDAPEGFDGIPLSLAWFVPKDNALSGRTGTSLADCLSGGEALVPLSDLKPPDIALRVDGLSVEDEGYPLVRLRALRVRMDSGEEGRPVRGRAASRIAKKIEALTALIRETPSSLPRTAPRVTWIAAGGDVMLDRGAGGILFDEGPAGIFGGTAEKLAGSDLALINLEGCVSSRGEKVSKSFNFRFEPKTAKALAGAGIDAVLVANNHIYDYGESAFLDTLAHLKDARLGILGAGLSDEEASRPAVFEADGTEIRVYGLASYPRERNGWDGLSVAAEREKAGILHAGKGGAEKLVARFSENRDGAPPLCVVLFHGGWEWSRRPDEATRRLYTDLVKSGADLVIGSHPHVVQGFEWIEGKAVFWSLGNYVFGGMENTDGGEEGLFITLGYAGNRLVYFEPFALSLTHTRTDIAPAGELETFYRLSRELQNTEDDNE
ncbi:MAG: CapA family protein [Treponema sp.]|jgi:poly-gamma-glutamate synthesis protein (capsule biosynthesis protein)|nr:CapA family protein [Treponema sp.]